MAQSDDAGGPSLHYRAYLPPYIAALITAVVASALFPLYWLATQAGTPSYLASPVVVSVAVLVPSVLLARDVVLTNDGRLTVTGLGQHIEVDVRRFTEIVLSAGARRGFGFARVRWNDGGFRIWQTMTYLPDPRHRIRGTRPSKGVTEDFRDLVYRLHLINPKVKIRGIEPPA